MHFSDYGLMSLSACWLTSRQIEAARRAIVRYVKRGGKIVIRVFPDKPVTKKAAETRMGSGKGAVDHWVAVVRPGQILFEISGVTEDQAKEAYRLAGQKLKDEFHRNGALGLIHAHQISMRHMRRLVEWRVQRAGG